MNRILESTEGDIPRRMSSSLSSLRTIQFIGLSMFLVCPLSFAQSSSVNLKEEEAAIRALISNRQMKYTEDKILWSGAFKRPIVASQTGEAYPEADIGKRKNETYSIDVHRIDLASSGDMAYEVSYGKLQYDVDATPVRRVVLDFCLLRVWKKVGREWKVAALFNRPLDLPFQMPADSRVK